MYDQKFLQLSALREANAAMRYSSLQSSLQLQALREEIELVQVCNSRCTLVTFQAHKTETSGTQ